MSLTETIKPMQEEATINKIMSLKQRPKPEIIVSEAFQKSIEIISKFDYKITTDENLIEYKNCYFCKNQFPTIQGKTYSCQRCAQTFCVKHRKYFGSSLPKIRPKFRKIFSCEKLV